MITIKETKIEETPVLFVEDAQIEDQAQPTVIYYHGFYGQKQDSLTIAYNIAKAGIRVILPDAYMHGARRGDLSRQQIDLSFWEIVMQNVKEIKAIYDYLLKHKLIIKGETKIGLGGTSMGGITTSAALTTYDWLDAGAVVMGSPNLADFAHLLIDNFNKAAKEPIPEALVQETLNSIQAIDLAQHPEKLQDRPLLFWHGTNDQVVPTYLSETFYEKHKTDHMRYVKETGRAHNVSRLAVQETSDWFKKHLLP